MSTETASSVAPLDRLGRLGEALDQAERVVARAREVAEAAEREAVAAEVTEMIEVSGLSRAEFATRGGALIMKGPGFRPAPLSRLSVAYMAMAPSNRRAR